MGHSPVLDGSDWHFQAFVLLTLSSAVNKLQQQQKNSGEKYLGPPGIEPGAPGWEQPPVEKVSLIK